MTLLRDAISSLLVRPVAFHPVLAKISGSAAAGLMLSQAIYWTNISAEMDEKNSKNTKRLGWFYKSQAEWQEEIFLTRYEQESARRQLRKFRFWEEDRRGVPAKLYFRVNLEKLAEVISQYVEKPHSRMLVSSMLKTHTLESGNPANKNGEKPHSFRLSETTSTDYKPENTKSKTEIAARVGGAKHKEAGGQPVEKPVLPKTFFGLNSEGKKHFTPPPWVKGSLALDLYRGIHAQAIARAFFDAKCLEPREQLAECVRVGTTTLVTSRVATLKNLDAQKIEAATLRGLLGGLATLNCVQDFETRKRATVQTVVRALVLTCIGMLEGKYGDRLADSAR